MKTFDLYFYLREVGSNSISRQVAVEVKENGEIVGVWIDGDPQTGTIEIKDLVAKIIGKSYVQHRVLQIQAAKEALEEAEAKTRGA